MWLQYFNAFWGPAVTVIGIIASVFMMYISTKMASRGDLEKLAAAMHDAKIVAAEHAKRLEQLEALFESEPSRQQLQNNISDLGEEVAELKGVMKGMAAQMETTSSYLKMLVESRLHG